MAYVRFSLDVRIVPSPNQAINNHLAAGGFPSIPYEFSIQSPPILTGPHSPISDTNIAETIKGISQISSANPDEAFCRGFVNADYVARTIDGNVNHMYMVLYGYDATNFSTVIGFLMGRLFVDKDAKLAGYIDVVCGIARGDLIVDSFIQLVQMVGGSYVQLSSLSHVLSYYPRFQFEHRKDCLDTDAPIAMPSELIKYIKDSKIGKESELETKLFMNPVVTHYLMELHRQGFTASAKPECANKGLKWSQFHKEECEIDGFAMRKCFLKSGATPQQKAEAASKATQWKSGWNSAYAPRERRRGGKQTNTRRSHPRGVGRHRYSQHPQKAKGTRKNRRHH